MFFVPDQLARSKRHEAPGYTLIEVLLATIIFSAMMFLAGMALNQSLKQYQGLVEEGLNFWEYAQRIWMDKSFHSIIDYYVYEPSHSWFPYFRGTQEGISYVTLSPFAGDLPVIVWIEKEMQEGGKLALVYYELPVYTKSYGEIESNFASGEYKKGQSTKILDGDDRIQFSFYGYDVRDEIHKWRDTFEGFNTKQLPMLVRIVYERGGREKEFMFAIHVNSQIKRNYRDRYGT